MGTSWVWFQCRLVTPGLKLPGILTASAEGTVLPTKPLTLEPQYTRDAFSVGFYSSPQAHRAKSRLTQAWEKVLPTLGCGLPRWLSGKEPTCWRRQHRFDPWSGRSPGEGSGNTLQDSCLENPMDRGTWQATIMESQKSWTRLSTWASMHTQTWK